MFMDENAFDIDPRQLAEGCRRFPHRPELHRPDAVVRPVHAPTGAFARHVWDESGHL